MEYDLIRLFEHPLRFRGHIAQTIIILGGDEGVGRCEVSVGWRTSASAAPQTGTLAITWDTTALRACYADIDDELEIARTRDENRAAQVENAAIVVAVAVMAHVEPSTRFTSRAGRGTCHDFYLNDTRDVMIEIAGEWEGGIPGLFAEKQTQSNRNPNLKRRWVSVTIFHTAARNRTEGLHT